MEREDPKLALLADILTSTPAQKVAVFASYADTVHYISEAIEREPTRFGGRRFTTIIGNESDAAKRTTELERFCPVSMTNDPSFVPSEGEVDLLLATDVVSEGQNLQQAQAVVSYDMPWNPQRVVQRNGRVIRLKSPHVEVFLYTLLPEPGDLDRLLQLEARLEAKIAAANASVGMESQVLSSVDAESRIYADLEQFARRLAAGDTALLDDGEGGGSGSFAGEDFRARLRRAQAEGEIEELKRMPWGVGATIVRATVPGVELPGVFFAARTTDGERKWRFVAANGEIEREQLNMLRLADPVAANTAPLEPSDSIDLDWFWSIAANDICAEHNAALDPATSAERLPLSQRWAREHLIAEGFAADPAVLNAAYESLAVGRGAIVQRALARVRNQQQAREISSLDATNKILETVEEFGLRPPEVVEKRRRAISADDLGVVCYQIVLPAA